MPTLLPCRMTSRHPPPMTGLAAWAWGALAWAAAWAAMLGLDGHIDLANQALLLVLGGVLASLWWPAWAALGGGALAVLGLNWTLVPPRGTLAVQRPQDALLLALLAGVLAAAVALVHRLRRQAAQARHHQQQAEQLRQLADALRDGGDPAPQAGMLQAALATLVDAPAALLLSRHAPPAVDDLQAVGATDADERAGLEHCLRQGQAMGPGTGLHGSLAQWYLPLRGSAGSLGAALLRLPQAGHGDAALRAHAQALCDQFGAALQQHVNRQAAQAAEGQAQLQAVRNAMLTAISHDHRTPLATILGAASSLHDQDQQLDAAQRRKLASRIVAEAQHLARLTDNTLQLARLDAPGMQLRRDWESAEELAGTALRRARQQAPQRQLRARLEPGLPLLLCDAMLLSQLLDNLLDNALKHTPAEVPIELLVRRDAAAPGSSAPAGVVLAVRDRGPGVSPAWRARIFEVFQRGEQTEAGERQGTGVGLAVCRAIARAHGGELRLRARAHGGSSFELHLPGAVQPMGDTA